MRGYPYHDKLPFCHWSLETLDPAPHLPLVATRSIARSVRPSVTYINPNTPPKELQLSSLGYFPRLRDEPLVILTRPVVTRASRSSIHFYHSCPSSRPIASGFASWLHHVPYNSLVLSTHEALMTSRIQSSMLSDMMAEDAPSARCVEGLAGFQSLSLSLARQCRQFGEGNGCRSG